MECEYILYYDTQRDMERCREGYNLWKQHRVGRENLLWVKDLREDPAVDAEHRDADRPILKMVAMPFVGWFGDEAISKMRELYSVSVQPPEPMVMPPSPVPMTARVVPRYVLYTNDIGHQIKVPANGVVNVQSYDLISTTLGSKLPKWLKQYRSLPVLATLEDNPTVWYGQAARDQCMMLSLLNGGLLPI